MGISMHFEDGFDCPLITCDSCGERIKGQTGLVAFDREDGRLRFLHKRTCDDRSLLWMEIETFLEHLAVNATDPPRFLRPLKELARAAARKVDEYEKDCQPVAHEVQALIDSALHDVRPRQKNGRPSRRSVSQRRRFAILQRDGFKCQLCGRSAEADGVTLHVDHQQPVSKGGSNDDENLWTLCSDCNLGKGARA